jgi:hypothetical protein
VSALAAFQDGFFATLFAAEDPADPRLAVYRHGALANLASALAGTYPVVTRLVGDAFFAEAARRHALATPSASGNLDDYGGDFPAFLAGYPHAQGVPYLADVARLEWALHEARRAAAARPLDLARLATLTPEGAGAVRVVLHPSVHLVASAYPVLAIWEANQVDRDGTPARDEGADRVLAFLAEGGARAELAGAAAWALARALRDGQTLGQACEAMGENAAEFPAALAWLAAAGLLCEPAADA